MIREIHYFSAELKTKIDVIPRGCLNFYLYFDSTEVRFCGRDWTNLAVKKLRYFSFKLKCRYFYKIIENSVFV